MENKPANNGLAIAALVCGILSLVCCWGYTSIAGLILGILAIIFAVKAKKTADPSKKGMIVAGLVCGIIGLVLSVVGFACTCLCVGTATAIESAVNNSSNWPID